MLRLQSEGETKPVQNTSLSEEGFHEDDLREWIIESPEHILGEAILIIGREVSVKDLGDAIDILGLDRDGNLVIIELKRGSLRDPVDFQGLKYAAYTAEWDYDDIKAQFERFRSTRWGSSLYNEDVPFQEKLEDFCNDEYTVNQEQRILLVGESIRERLNLVIRWLSDRDIDVAVIEVDLLKEGERLYVDAEQTIPLPEESPPDVRPDTSDKPWESDGRSWHLNERSKEATAELVQQIVGAVENVEELSGPEWGQKFYIAFRQARRNRVLVRTHQEHCHVRVFDIEPDEVDEMALSKAIEMDEDRVDATEQLSGTRRPGVQITCMEGDTIKGEPLAEQISKLLSD